VCVFLVFFASAVSVVSFCMYEFSVVCSNTVGTRAYMHYVHVRAYTYARVNTVIIVWLSVPVRLKCPIIRGVGC